MGSAEIRRCLVVWLKITTITMANPRTGRTAQVGSANKRNGMAINRSTGRTTRMGGAEYRCGMVRMLWRGERSKRYMSGRTTRMGGADRNGFELGVVLLDASRVVE